jgi:hypothetical protein
MPMLLHLITVLAFYLAAYARRRLLQFDTG